MCVCSASCCSVLADAPTTREPGLSPRQNPSPCGRWIKDNSGKVGMQQNPDGAGISAAIGITGGGWLAKRALNRGFAGATMQEQPKFRGIPGRLSRMTQAVEQLLQSALALPENERLQLLTALMSAVEEQGLRPFDDEWLSEIQRRSAEYDAGGVQPLSWAEVKARARQELARRG